MTNVVIIDDDHDTVQIFSQLLTLKGVNVIGKGYNGKEAVALYRELKPDVLITDLKMPEFDGIFAINGIKSEFPDAKIIVVTGFSEEYGDVKNKVSAVLTKPYEINDVLKVIHNCLEETTLTKKLDKN